MCAYVDCRFVDSNLLPSSSSTVSDSVFEGVKERKKKSRDVDVDISDVNAYVAKHANDSSSEEDMF